jgi:hypothetical protein
MKILLAVILSFTQLLVFAQIQSNGSGLWSSGSTWVGGVVPGATDDVEITGNHVITLDLSPTGTEIIDLCKALTVQIDASLQLGYDGVDQVKQFLISGNLHCDGTIASGRNVPADGNSGEGLIFDRNSTLVLQLSSLNTTITGKGYLHPKSLIIQNQGSPRQLTIDHYNIIMDSDFIVKGLAHVEVEIAKYTYMNAGSTVAIAGRTYSSSPANFSANMLVKGIIYTNNLSLFTRNETNSTSITLDNEGVITANNINGGVNPANSGAGGFQLTLNERSIFRCGASGVQSPEVLAASDPNFTVVNNGEIKIHYSQILTGGTQVLSQVNAFDKYDRDQVEAIKDKIGATHIAGWYNFTNKGYLEEGMDRFKEWGSTNIKTTISADNGKMKEAYPFNSAWPVFAEMKDVINDERVDQLFSDPYFTSHAFWAPSKGVNGFYKNGADRTHSKYLEVEEQNYRAAKELLTKYGDMGKKFLFQNWEGDWMLRGNNKQWEDNPANIPDDVQWEIEGMARMWRASMRGIEKAVAEFPNATSEIQYAVEYNKLFDNVNGVRKPLMEIGIPCLVADVLPKVRMHMASWSAYDGNWEESGKPYPTGFWNGMEIAGYFTNNTKGLEGVPVQIGEIGLNENTPFKSLSDAEIISRYDKIIAMTAKLGVQNVYIWNLYNSGAQSVALEKDTQYAESYLYQVLDGKWVIEPDNTFGLVGGHLKDNYFNDFNIDPVVSQTIEDVYVNIGFGTEEIDLSEIFYDSDGDDLTLTATVSDETIVVATLTSNLLTLTEQGVGTTIITIKADDGNEGTASMSFRINVLASRDPHVFINSVDYTTVSQAVNAAQDGDVIEIRGIHTESLTITKSITLRGLDPKIDKIQSALSTATAQSRVISINRTGDFTGALNVTIENLGIRHGKDAENGGGINADKLNGLITLKNLIIEKNASSKNGGAVSIAGSNAVIEDCAIRFNTATLDGGGFIVAPNNSVTSNIDITMKRTLIDGNEGRNGGGVYINGNNGFGNNNLINVYLENTTISKNIANSDAGGTGGGGIWSKSAFWTGDNATANTSIELVHCTLYSNSHSSTSKNGIIFTSDPAGAETSFIMYNSIALSGDDILQNVIDFNNANTTGFVNNMLGSVSGEPAMVATQANNNSVDRLSTYVRLDNTLAAQGGKVPTLSITSGSPARNFCTASTNITLPSTDSRGFNRDATPDAGAYEFVESLTINDTYYVTTDVEFEQMTVGPNGVVIVQPAATLNINGNIENNGSVIVESGGALALLGTAAGNATIKKKTTGDKGYSIIGASVSGIALSELEADYLYTYNETQSNWTVPTEAMQPGVGFFVGFNEQAPEVSFSGGMISGAQIVDVTKGGDGFNLVANPFAAAISISEFLSNSTNANTTTGTLYFWDDGGSNVGAQRGGDYITVNNLGVTVSTINLADGVSGKKGTTAASTGYIGSVQGFFIQAAVAGEVVFTPAMQVTTSYANTDTGFYRSERLGGQMLKLSLANETQRDEIIIGFTESASMAIDYGLDARKFVGGENLSFFSMGENERLAIQGLPFNESTEEMVTDLGMDLPGTGEFQIKVERIQGFDEYSSVVLRDNTTGDLYELSADKIITFQEQNELIDNKRFQLIVKNEKASLAVQKPKSFQFYGNENGLTLLYDFSDKAQVSIYTLTGQLVYDELIPFESSQARIYPSIQKQSVYILRVGDMMAKFIIR